MKVKLTFALIVSFGILIIGCVKEEQKIKEEPIDIINDEFPEEQEELQKVLDGIFMSFRDKDADKLISYHIYSSKFTEFRNDASRFGSVGNEEYERGFVGAISAFDYNLGDLKINVFGDMAIATFEADFRPTIAGQVHQIWANVTLVFVKVNDTWKITHEHFSQFEKPEKG
jgi:ketosteroid isomerase-like protein